MLLQILQQALDLRGLADAFTTLKGDEAGTIGFGRFEHDERCIRVSEPAKSQLSQCIGRLAGDAAFQHGFGRVERRDLNQPVVTEHA